MASCEIDQTGQEDLMEKRKRVLNKACIKCKCTQTNLVVRGLVYCKPCIQALVVQRFKRSINQVIPPAQAASTVLALGFSGGLGSTLLLDLVAQVLSADSKRTRHHRWERIHVIHVDDSNVNAQQNPRISVQARDIDNALSSYPHLTLVKVPLENAFEGAQSSGSFLGTRCALT
jgi:cytoplasmic tRNA 2-thiolation protein 2